MGSTPIPSAMAIMSRKKVANRMKAIRKKPLGNKSPPPPPPTSGQIYTSVIEEQYDDPYYCDPIPESKKQKKVLVNGFEGYYCVCCNKFSTHVDPNMPDGSFVCGECRFEKKLMEQ